MSDLIHRELARRIVQSEEAQDKKLEKLDNLKSVKYDHMADWQPDIEPNPGEYFITWEGFFGEKKDRWIEIAEWDGEEWCIDHILSRGFKDVKVIAWMNLPDKWEGE